MVKVSPWSVKGIEPDVRETAKNAARQAGMTLGQWLNCTIRAAAAQQAVTPSEAARDTAVPATGKPAAEETPAAGNSAVAIHRPENRADNGNPAGQESVFDKLVGANGGTDCSDPELEERIELPSTQHKPEKATVVAPVFRKVNSPAAVESALQRLSEKVEKAEAARQADLSHRRPALFNRAR